MTASHCKAGKRDFFWMPNSYRTNDQGLQPIEESFFYFTFFTKFNFTRYGTLFKFNVKTYYVISHAI